MIVTSWGEKGWEQYGKKFVETFLKHWKEENLIVYYEVKPDFDHERVEFVDLFSVDGMTDTLEKLKNSDPIFMGLRQIPNSEKYSYDYRYDAYRFCRKVFAMADAAIRCTDNVMCWIDADVIFHEDIPPDFIKDNFLNEETGAFIAYLARPQAYSETGFIAFDMRSDDTRGVIETMRRVYGKGIFRWLGEWHDCYIFDFLRELSGVKTYDISNGMIIEHPFISSILGEYMDHMKGPQRKEAGRSAKNEHIGLNKTDYWLNEGEKVQGIQPKRQTA